jgi:hypothetical protein
MDSNPARTSDDLPHPEGRQVSVLGGPQQWVIHSVQPLVQLTGTLTVSRAWLTNTLATAPPQPVENSTNRTSWCKRAYFGCIQRDVRVRQWPR